jgi:hypothetical protein
MADNSTLTTEPTYSLNNGDTAWVMICACLVFLMVKDHYLQSQFIKQVQYSHLLLDSFMQVSPEQRMRFHSCT